MQNKERDKGLAAFFGLLISGLLEDLFGTNNSTDQTTAAECNLEEYFELEVEDADLLDEFLDSGLF